jgi:pimeloyl-ACP methyl ester carboxylesterase
MSSARRRRRDLVATFVLIPGAGSDGWFWHLVNERLAAHGHHVIAVDLPWSEPSATFSDLAAVVVAALAATPRRDGPLLIVAQSLGGFVGPLVCDRVEADLLILLAAMVPTPGESAGEWWTNTGFVWPEPFDEHDVFLHDVPGDLAAASADHISAPADRLFEDPWPLSRWPGVPTRFLLCRDDRFFPASFLRRVAGERLGITPDEMDGGHLSFLAQPDQLTAWLEKYCIETAG